MPILIWIIIFCLLIGMLSVAAAGCFLLLPSQMRQRLLPHMISFATGTLLGAAFLALLPHALDIGHEASYHRITFTVLLGLLVFFLLEKMVLWRHCHAVDCEAHHAREHAHQHDGVAGPVVLLGDGIHNLIHGVLIAAAFLVDIDLGIVTSLAVMAHQLPQELSNFIVLLNSGYDRGRAMLMNLLSSLTAPLGGLLGYSGLRNIEWIMPYMLAIAVASCIYIALTDLIPGLHKQAQIEQTVKQMVLIAAGVAVIHLSHFWLH